MLVLVRYKPADAMAADDMFGGYFGYKAVVAVEDAASSIPRV